MDAPGVAVGVVLVASTLLLGLVATVDRWSALRSLERWMASGGHPSGPGSGGPGARREDGGGLRGAVARLGGRRTEDPGARLALVVAEVAARLRAGAPTARAWQETWARATGLPPLGGTDPSGVPEGVAALARAPRWAEVVTGDPGRSVTRVRAVVAASSARSRATRRAAAAVVAACRFTHHLGAPLAEVLERVADGIDEAAAAQDARRVAGQGPRTSTRVLTALPLLGVLAAEVLGANPLGRFTDGGVGTLCLVIGVLCLLGGHLVARSMLRRAEDGDEDLDAALLCDLAVSGLESGASVPAVLGALGVATEVEDLTRIGRELVLGASWNTAWEPLPTGAALIADALEPAWCDGTSPVPLLERAAAQTRARRVADARARAEELGVRLVVPLGVFLLPAFIALGVVPVLLHLAGSGVDGLM